LNSSTHFISRERRSALQLAWERKLGDVRKYWYCVLTHVHRWQSTEHVIHSKWSSRSIHSCSVWHRGSKERICHEVRWTQHWRLRYVNTTFFRHIVSHLQNKMVIKSCHTIEIFRRQRLRASFRTTRFQTFEPSFISKFAPLIQSCCMAR
jgi:hypothetical protein